MVNNVTHQHALGPLRQLTTAYVALTVATLAALATLSATGSALAGRDAWVHQVIVTVFAVVLPLRVAAARRGSAEALRAVGIIAGVLFLVNVVEALLPDLFPVWMRIEMGLAAVVTLSIVAFVIHERR